MRCLECLECPSAQVPEFPKYSNAFRAQEPKCPLSARVPGVPKCIKCPWSAI